MYTANLSGPNYVFLTEIEKQFNGTDALMLHRGRHYLMYISIVLYVALVFYGRHYMKSRGAFELRIPLIIWNALLSVFSLIGAIRIGPELLYSVSTYGFYHSVCSLNVHRNGDSVLALWIHLMVYSKMWELGDTVFLVLRKRPVIFLHWYHHVIVLYYAFVAYRDEIAYLRYTATVNYVIHSYMYGYYALRALNVKLPIWISKFITLTQLLQMFIALFVNFAAFGFYRSDTPCQMNNYIFYLAFFMYISFVVLFSSFFYHAYIKKSKHV